MKKYKHSSTFMESFIKDRQNTMNLITQVLKNKDIDFCFIGGAVLPDYHYERMTSDIDILISYKDKEKFLTLIGSYFKRKFKNIQKSLFWNNPKTEIDIIFSREKAGDINKGIPYKEPKELSKMKHSVPILTLKNIVQYKLCAGLYGKVRLKDFSDIQQLIHINKLPIDFADKFRDDIKNKYIELWKSVFE